MYRDVALWRQVRHRMLDSGTSKRRISKETGISRPTIRKMAAFERPPGYGPRITRYPKLGPYIDTIDQLLEKPVSLLSRSLIQPRNSDDSPDKNTIVRGRRTCGHWAARIRLGNIRSSSPGPSSRDFPEQV